MNELQIKEPDLTPIKQRIYDHIQFSQSVIVHDSESQAVAITATNNLIYDLHEVEAKEDEFTNPLSEVLKKFRAIFKPTKDDLNQAIKDIKKKSTDYFVEQKELERKEQERLNKLAQKKFDRNEANGKPNPLPVPVAPHVEIAQKRVEGATMVDHWVAEVVDLSKVPLFLNGIQLLQPNTATLNKLANDSKGKVEIPGILVKYAPYQRTTR